MIQGLEEYTKKSRERLIVAASNSNFKLRTNNKTVKSRKQRWKEKQLYEYFRAQRRILHMRWAGNGYTKET